MRSDADVLDLLTAAIQSAKHRRFIAVSIDLDVAEQLREMAEPIVAATRAAHDVGDGHAPTPDAPIDADCWRDLLSVRTINALLNEHGMRAYNEKRERTVLTAGEVFARSDADLLKINHLGPKGVNQIHRARARMIAASRAEA
jgi:DNA-directed RNA polymerase alpha subunit